MPTSQIIAATSSAIAALVAMVLIQGRQPSRIWSKGQPVLQKKQIGGAEHRT